MKKKNISCQKQDIQLCIQYFDYKSFSNRLFIWEYDLFVLKVQHCLCINIGYRSLIWTIASWLLVLNYLFLSRNLLYRIWYTFICSYCPRLSWQPFSLTRGSNQPVFAHPVKKIHWIIVYRLMCTILISWHWI